MNAQGNIRQKQHKRKLYIEYESSNGAGKRSLREAKWIGWEKETVLVAQKDKDDGEG